MMYCCGCRVRGLAAGLFALFLSISSVPAESTDAPVVDADAGPIADMFVPPDPASDDDDEAAPVDAGEEPSPETPGPPAGLVPPPNAGPQAMPEGAAPVPPDVAEEGPQAVMEWLMDQESMAPGQADDAAPSSPEPALPPGAPEGATPLPPPGAHDSPNGGLQLVPPAPDPPRDGHQRPPSAPAPSGAPAPGGPPGAPHGGGDMPTVLPPRPAPFQPQRGLEGIHLAVELGDLEAVKRYLEETPGRVGEDTSRGVTPLHMAVAYNAGEIARLLVEKGAPVNARTDNGMTPLHYAAMTGRADFVRMLLDAGAHEGLRNVRGNTPADLARRARVTEVVNILEPPAPEEAEDDPLLEAHAFIRGGDLENLEAWAASNPEDLEALDNEGRTLLMFAAVEDQPIIAEWLLDQGVDPGKRGSEAMTALHWAAKHGSLAVIEQLLDHGADIDVEDGEYRTALFYALDNGQSEAASLLIERGASVDGRDDGLTPLHLAAAYRNVDLVERLVEQGADPRARTRDGKTPWDYAQEAGFSDVARILADSDPGFEPDAPAEEDGGAVEDDEQPLDTVPPEEDAPVSPAERLANAFTEGDESVVLELLGQNRELASWRCEQGLTPLHHAAIVGMGEVAEYLLTEGTDPNARNAAGQTPLHYAEVFQRGAIADALIAAGADPETGDVHGDTPKQLARDFDRRYNRTGQDDAGPRPLTRVRGEDDLAFMVRQGVRAMNTGREDELFAMLDEEPAMLSAPDRRGQTLLHHAVQEENTPVTTQLLERGAPVNAEDSQGRRPVFYAVELGRLDLVELLREHGAEFAPADDNLTALHVAVAARDYGMTAYLLDAGLSVNERTRGGKSPLDYATELGYAELADLLAARGAHVDAPNPRGTSGVFSAAAQRSLADF